MGGTEGGGGRRGDDEQQQQQQQQQQQHHHHHYPEQGLSQHQQRSDTELQEDATLSTDMWQFVIEATTTPPSNKPGEYESEPNDV